MTSDMWHVTRDMWHVGGVNILSKFLSLAFTVCDLLYYEDSEEKADLLNKWMK